jgi:hypothetical protein
LHDVYACMSSPSASPILSRAQSVRASCVSKLVGTSASCTYLHKHPTAAIRPRLLLTGAVEMTSQIGGHVSLVHIPAPTAAGGCSAVATDTFLSTADIAALFCRCSAQLHSPTTAAALSEDCAQASWWARQPHAEHLHKHPTAAIIPIKLRWTGAAKTASPVLAHISPKGVSVWFLLQCCCFHTHGVPSTPPRLLHH